MCGNTFLLYTNVNVVPIYISNIKGDIYMVNKKSGPPCYSKSEYFRSGANASKHEIAERHASYEAV